LVPGGILPPCSEEPSQMLDSSSPSRRAPLCPAAADPADHSNQPFVTICLLSLHSSYYLRKGGCFHCCVFSADAVCFFGHICRADLSQDHSRALYASTTGLPKHWRRRPGRPRQTWLRTIQKDLRPLSLGLATAQRRAQNRTAWQTLVETATSPTSSG